MTLAAAAWVVTMTVCRGECPVKLSPCSSCWCEMRVRVMCVRANRVMRVAHENTHTARARARTHTHTHRCKNNDAFCRWTTACYTGDANLGWDDIVGFEYPDGWRYGLAGEECLADGYEWGNLCALRIKDPIPCCDAYPAPPWAILSPVGETIEGQAFAVCNECRGTLTVRGRLPGSLAANRGETITIACAEGYVASQEGSATPKCLGDLTWTAVCILTSRKIVCCACARWLNRICTGDSEVPCI